MKIELLHIDDCPNWQEVLGEIRDLLSEKGLEDEVELIRVTSSREAERLQFPGSPTIRVNGEDVDPDVPSSGFELPRRVYEVDGELQERPPREWIDAALDEASE